MLNVLDCGHTECTCGWCLCWVQDPEGNNPPVPIAHIERHRSVIPVQATYEDHRAPMPLDDLDDEEIYVPS
jgi:hypothetical protein